MYEDEPFADNSAGPSQTYTMKTRLTLVALTLFFSVSLRAADPAVAALVTKIESNPTSDPAVAAQIIASNPGLASELLKAAYNTAPENALAILKATASAVPELAPTALEQALLKLTTGLDAESAAKVAASFTSIAIETVFSAQLPPAAKSKLAAAIAATAARAVPAAEGAIVEAAARSAPGASAQIKNAVQPGRSFPLQRPAIIVSPSR